MTIINLCKTTFQIGASIVLLSGCMTTSQKEFIAMHPELTAVQIDQVKKQQVRPGQSMEMVKAMLGTPYRQAAPGYPKDILFYWTPNDKPAPSSYTPPPKDKDEALNQTLSRAVDVAAKAIHDPRGTLHVIYFVNGRVSHDEIRLNALPEDMSSVRNEVFFTA